MMMMLNNRQEIGEIEPADAPCLDDEKGLSLPLQAMSLAHPHPTTQYLLSAKTNRHSKEAGFNPLVDSAATLFSLMGKIKHIKTHGNLAELHEELAQEIENFQESVQNCSYQPDYLAEYLPISCYALCATFDDIIANMPWGNQGKWDNFSLVVSFNQEALTPENFLIILERLVRDPAIYIDVIEFIYICLNLGMKCRHETGHFANEQLEQIVNALYKRIRVERGNYSRILSPFALKKTSESAPHRKKKLISWLKLIIVFLFIGGLGWGSIKMLTPTFSKTKVATQKQLVNNGVKRQST